MASKADLDAVVFLVTSDGNETCGGARITLASLGSQGDRLDRGWTGD